MMKQFFCIILFLTVGFDIYPQCVSAPYPMGTIRDTTAIDSGSVRIYYAMNAVDINDIKTYDDMQRLDIGTAFSKYYSFFRYNNDSLRIDWKKKNPRVGSVPGFFAEIGKRGTCWSLFLTSVFYKDFIKNTFTEYAPMPIGVPHKQYTEELPVQKWVLQKDTLTIRGYLCKKATCRFRGRDFVAWYAPDIPLSNGPWKFGGLPGLILKISDKNLYYVFECIKVETFTNKYPIDPYYDNYYEKTERTVLRKLEKDIHEDYDKVLVSLGLKIQPGKKNQSVPYIPLELE